MARTPENACDSLQVDMICEATGGPCFYTGRDMKTVHKGLGINGEDWQLMLSNSLNLLETFKVHDEEQKEIIEILSNLKKGW
ncbi:MAG: hypothetical protein MUO26_13715 [Methanotrichaceae archaeon]|nr:hypothetical protein [Methanotrichaceae archaeon]